VALQSVFCVGRRAVLPSNTAAFDHHAIAVLRRRLVVEDRGDFSDEASVLEQHPFSVFRDKERGSKFIEPTNPIHSSTVKAFVCKLALLDPNSEMSVSSLYGLSSNKLAPPSAQESR
jgi:hypothetical protein